MGLGDAWTPGFEVTLRVPTGDPGKTLPGRLVPNVSAPTHRVTFPQKKERNMRVLHVLTIPQRTVKNYTTTYTLHRLVVL